MFTHLKTYTQEISRKGLWRTRGATRTLSKAKILANGQNYINFCSNDYLALSGHPRLKQVMQSHIQKFGFGSTSSPLLSGYSLECEDLEKTFCSILGFEDALVFPSGYQANIGVLSALLTRTSTVLCDRLCHASIMDGLTLSRAKIKRFHHNDVAHVAGFVKAYLPDLLVTESVFSMEGDIAPIDKLSYPMIPLFVDDAHGFGVLGALDYWKLRDTKPDILTIPFGKALGMSGAIVLGNKAIISLILQHCRSYRYSTAISPAICVGILEGLDIMFTEEWRLEKLRQLIHFFNTCAAEVDLPILSEDITPIRSLLIGDPHKTLAVARHLKNNGIYAAAIRPPTVPNNTSRLRISLTCAHQKPDIHRLVTVIKEAMTCS
ncbi:MAG: 8-amino-7-oxononanoate synthase [Proteobacteria bacterium]|nr:8-amino-7-oxononanoate synthase [Pseudomonadota bacterium]